MELLCSNPCIIINPLLPEVLHKSSAYYINGREFIISDGLRQRSYIDFPWKLFSKKRHNPTHESLDNYFFVDAETAETYPIFIEVCCGKCRICMNQKSSELTTRFLCETSTSIGQVLFIRLSYNNYSLPFDAFSKRHCQLFFKRLRKKLTTLGYDVNLRYFLVSEYGGTFGRPHYHLVLWNFPTWDFRLHQIKAIIEDCWSISISYDLWTSLPPIFRFKRSIKRWNIGKRQYYWCYDYRQHLGYVDVRYYTKKGSSSKAGFDYLTKYVRKEQGEKAHELDQKPFTLSSRRGGLGSAWLEQNKDFYYNNPECVELEVKVPFEDNPIRCILPKFFRNKLFPSRSSFFPKKVRDAFKEYVLLFNARNTITYHFNGKDKHWYTDDDLLIKEKYNMMPWYHMSITNNYWIKSIIRKWYPSLLKVNTTFEVHHLLNTFTREPYKTRVRVYIPYYQLNKDVIFDSFLCRVSDVIVWRLNKLAKILKDYQFPFSYDKLQYLRAHHQNSLSTFMHSLPDIDINEYDEYLQREEVRRMHREGHTNDNE